MTNIAIFASGVGTNAQTIIDYFRHHPFIKIALIVSNKPGAGVLMIAEKESIPSLIIEKDHFFLADAYVHELKTRQIDFIVLAGFLWKIPSKLIAAYPEKIINIHPALLPKYGGKSMYGSRVHEAVIAAREKESGITIHYVDELYDHGNIIHQANCRIEEKETPASLAQKIQALEHTHYPAVIEKIVQLQNHR
jgi:phosphoribosylglycinamide formyltransferase 1